MYKRQVHAPTGGTFYKLSFPLPLSNQLFLYIPSKDIEDVLTAAKMADSVIQLFLSRPSQSVQSVRQSDTMLLLDHLFHPSTAEEDTYTALLAAELGFDMSLPRAVCIFLSLIHIYYVYILHLNLKMSIYYQKIFVKQRIFMYYLQFSHPFFVIFSDKLVILVRK